MSDTKKLLYTLHESDWTLFLYDDYTVVSERTGILIQPPYYTVKCSWRWNGEHSRLEWINHSPLDSKNWRPFGADAQREYLEIIQKV